MSLFAGLVTVGTGAQAHACSGPCSVSVQQIGAYSMYAEINQAGPDNQAQLTQIGPGYQSATLHQTSLLQSSGNSAAITQAGSAADSFRGLQTGSDNTFAIIQSAVDCPDQASVTQIGTMNVATVTQAGGDNTATIYQYGQNAKNVASIVQTGVGDVAIASQYGSGDTQSITQTSVNDYASYTQIGNNLPDIKISETSPNQSVTVVQKAR
jgi:hypothetical protein